MSLLFHLLGTGLCYRAICARGQLCDVLAGAALGSGLTLVHLGGKAQGAQGLLHRGWVAVDIHKHERLPISTQAWLHSRHQHQHAVIVR